MNMLNRSAVEKSIRDAIGASNLVVYESNFDQLGWLRIFLHEDGQGADVSLGNAPGNAYRNQALELHIHAATTHDDYSECDESFTEDDVDAQVSSDYVDAMMGEWLDQCEAEYNKSV